MNNEELLGAPGSSRLQLVLEEDKLPQSRHGTLVHQWGILTDCKWRIFTGL